MSEPNEQQYADQINQELYKRNAELAFHNKMLSLMRRLYSITLTTYSVRQTSETLISEIIGPLRLKLVRILFVKNEDDLNVSITLVASAPKLATKILGDVISKNNEVYKKVFGEGKPFILDEATDLYSRYGLKGTDEAQKLLLGVSAAVYPLTLNGKCKGLLLIVFSKKYSDLTPYEIETIENFASLASIAVDKSTVYEELEGVNQKLENQNLRLQELDRQKTDFLSIAAHQLRTPLSIANGYIELLEDGAYGKITKESREILNNMDESNGHLVKLVDEFLNITRIEQGRTKFDFKKQDLRTVINGAVTELVDRAEQKGLRLVWSSPRKLAEANIDDEKIRHVIFNFIDNAIKYTDKGSIKIMLKPDGKGWAITVTDKGFGFEKIDEANFFQKFYRGENVKCTNVTGTGLGLYVCKMFIEGHGGRVWAHSPGLKKGSEFGFWIPSHGVAAKPVTVDKTAQPVEKK